MATEKQTDEAVFHRKAAVLFVKRGSRFLGGMFWVPEGIGFDQHVEDGKQLTHAGNVDDFEGFAGFFQALGEGFDHGIHAFCCESRHVEHAAQLSPSTANPASTAELAAIAIEGSDSHQGCDLTSIQFSQLRQLR